MQQSGHVLESLCVLPPDPRTIFIVPEISNYLHFCFSSVLLLRFLSLSSLSSKLLPVVRVRPSLIPAGCLAACVLLGASLSLGASNRVPGRTHCPRAPACRAPGSPFSLLCRNSSRLLPFSVSRRSLSRFAEALRAECSSVRDCALE